MSEDANEVVKLRRKASRFCIIDDEVHRRGFSLQLLKSIHKEKAKLVLDEIHKVECGGHYGP